MNDLRCLIISSSIDYSTDLICIQLEKQHISYLRINRDQFDKFQITLSVYELILRVKFGEKEYIYRNSDRNSIYFRAPVFIRTMNKKYSLDEQVYKSQWSAFMRNLIVFDRVKWVNNPVNTYRAENKVFQLAKAKENGLMIPDTKVANCCFDIVPDNKYIVKSIDTALFNNDDIEMFMYTSRLSGNEIMNSNLSLAPVFIQDYIENKTDIRVTYISGKVFPVKITSGGGGIDCDWRKKKKDDLEYEMCALPDEIIVKLTNLMKSLNLEFGGVDLIKSGKNYYFIEVNPTGEWGWLQSNIDVPIDEEITRALVTL